jgi:diguanylate cyclase (GGDEF)-like protein
MERMPASAAHVPIESTAAAYWAMLRRIALAAAAIDLGLLLLYSLLGAKALALLNLVSIAIYVTAYWLLYLRRNAPAVLLIWFEVLAHAAAGSLLLGWEADFHYFLLLFVPAIVVGAPHRRAVPLMALLLALYAGLYMACQAWAPLSPLPPAQLEIARWFNIVMVFGLFYGVTAFYRQRVRTAESALRRLARIDVLTGLSNRAHFQERAAAELSRARREDAPVTMMLADVDHFKLINDTHGHDAGDRMLAAVARCMASTLREHDLLARWGGEEFMALLPATGGAEACTIAERVRQAVASTTVVVDGNPLSVTLSFGLAEVQAGDLQAATRRADDALYVSKRSGRNRMTHADDPGAPPAPPPLPQGEALREPGQEPPRMADRDGLSHHSGLRPA